MASASALLGIKLRLHVRKSFLMGRIFVDQPHYIKDYGNLKRLVRVISREIAVNRKLLHLLKVYAESQSSRIEPFIVQLEKTVSGLIFVLRQELKVLRRINMPKLIVHEAKVLLFNRPRTDAFDSHFAMFQKLCAKEQEIDSRLFEIVVHEAKGATVSQVQFYRKIARDIRARQVALVKSVGNNALVRKNAEDILKLLRKLQDTELYIYMRSDINFIKGHLKSIIRNPRESKVRTLLVGAYLFTPGSFDTTIYILLVKNLTKVAIKKIRARKMGRFAVRQRAS